jgi:hypothetical protein
MAEIATINTVEEALVGLGVTAKTLSDYEKKTLDEQGYLVLPKVIDPTWLVKFQPGR